MLSSRFAQPVPRSPKPTRPPSTLLFPFSCLVPNCKTLSLGWSRCIYSATSRVLFSWGKCQTKKVVNATLPFHELCQAFIQPTYASIPAHYKVYFTAQQHSSFSSKIRALKTNKQQELACVFVANLFDPKTGYDAGRSLICPSGLQIQEGIRTSLWTANDFKEGKVGGMDMMSIMMEVTAAPEIITKNPDYPGSTPANWTSMANSVNEVVTATNITGAELYQALRHSVTSARDSAVVVIRHMEEEMNKMMNTQAEKVSDLVLGVMGKTDSFLYSQGAALGFGVYNQYSNDFSHTITDACGLQTSSGTCTAATHGGTPCVWQGTTNKCGIQLQTNTDVANQLKGNISNSKLFDNINGELTSFSSQLTGAISSTTEELSITFTGSSFLAMKEFAEKAGTASVAAINKVKYLVGTFISFIMAAKMIPFSLAISTGVVKGVKQFKKIAGKSKVLDHPADKRKIKIFTGLLLFVCGSVVAVPLLVVPMMIYQSFANQYFMFSILGFVLFVVNNMISGFYESTKTGLILSVVAVFFILLGTLLWFMLDEDQLLKNALLSGKDTILKLLISKLENFSWLVYFIMNFAFSFFYSKLVAANLVAWLTSKMFSDYGQVMYTDEQTGELVPSRLHKFNLWPKINRKSDVPLKASVLVVEENEPLQKENGFMPTRSFKGNRGI
mmetsp:Transcript_14911/g.29261  ORF Transcript_14911/g.29261 Transcript_14911/m.29261 type:complete len:671 (+) Transcript_14911:829-2841(+)